MIKDSYIEIYREFSDKLKSESCDALNALRDKALDAFESGACADLPEQYGVNYGLNLNRVSLDENPYKIFSCDIPTLGAYTFYVVNDKFYASDAAAALPNGVVVCALSEAFEKYPDIVNSHIGRQMNVRSNSAEALNALLAQDGLFVYVPKGVRLEKPVQLVNLMYGNVDMMAVSHNLIVIEDDAAAALLVCDHAVGENKYLSNRVTEVFVGRNATYDHYKAESTTASMANFCSLLIDQKEGAEVVSNIITLNCGITKNNIISSLSGEHSSVSLCGISLADKKQNISNETYIHHLKPDTSSFESFKYILDDEAKGNFYGMIKVYPDAQKSVAMQTNKNICLTTKAQMTTKPQLEIYADDVKCNHGATVGQLDETAKFYMLSRGISESEARMLLMSAFVHDVLEKIRIEAFKDRVRMLVEKRLRKEPTKCTLCKSCTK